MGVRARARVDRHRHARGLVRPVHQRRVRRAEVGEAVRDDQPGDRGAARRRSRRPGRRTWRSPSRRPATRRTAWRALPGAERAKYLYRIARQLQERAREFAVLESMNGGKPIKESRDIDIPLAAAHFFYYAGLGRQAGVRVPRPARPSDRRGGPDHPVELPDADGRVEARAGARDREHAGAEAGRDHAADRAAARAGDPGGRAAAGRGEHRDRRRRDGRGAGGLARRQDRVHRLDRGRQADPALDRRAAASGSRWSSAARPRTSCSRTRRSIRPSRAW